MRKHSVRKWLHAILDLLPVILIPVFMVYSHRHDIEGNQAQVSQSLKLDFNQLTNVNDSVNYNRLNSYSFEYSDTTLNWRTLVRINDLVVSHVYYLHCLDSNGANQSGTSYQFYSSVPNNYYLGKTITDKLFTNIEFFTLQSGFYNGSGYTGTFYLNFYDLTQMFGAGNEPTIEEFNNLFHNDYFNYTLSKDYWIENYSTVTYDDTDIMSQITYQLFNATDKYFNMDKTFNLGNIHTWVNNYMFGGQPPLIANIVWHIISYEFIMDLIFLVYAVFMFVIDFADRCLNSFFDKSFGGGR